MLQLTSQSMPRQKGVIDEDDEDETDHFAISKEGEEYDDGTEAKKMMVIFQICTKDENDDDRANGRAWGDGENREHYSNQLSGQVVYKNLYLGYH